MTLTLLGFVQFLIGSAIVLWGNLRAAFFFLIASALFGGSAAIVLPALGGSSIPPSQFALVFVFLRIFMPKGGYSDTVVPALRANAMLAAFTVYGLAAAIAAPRIFAGEMNVVPLRPGSLRFLFDTVPLAPTPQNLTASTYIVGTLLTALAAYVACAHKGGTHTLVKAGIFMAWFHALTGLFGLWSDGTPFDIVLNIFRNGSYAQLEQSYAGFVRINGVFPEASGWASFGFGIFVLNAECWYRSIMSRHTGRAALLLLVVLFFSTSATAYLSLGIYAVFFLLRVLLTPQDATAMKLRDALVLAVLVALVAAVAVVVMPSAMAELGDMLNHMLFDKADSSSGRQRLFWAMQGWDAFVTSGGLGIGPGSFRSSSLLTAILGSMGLVGLLTFAAYVMQVVRPALRSTWMAVDDLSLSAGGALGTAALLSLIPAAISAPAPNPGTLFAVFAGAALALRPPWKDPVSRSDWTKASPGLAGNHVHPAAREISA